MEDSNLRAVRATWLQARMKDGSWNQSSLGRKADVSRETVWRILNRKTDAGPETIGALATAMGCRLPSFLVRGDGRAILMWEGIADFLEFILDPGAHRDRPTGLIYSDDGAVQFRTTMRNIYIMALTLMGDVAAPPSEEIRQVQLAVCRMAIRSSELAGTGIPAFVIDVYNELIKGACIGDDTDPEWVPHSDPPTPSPGDTRHGIDHVEAERKAANKKEGKG